MSGSEDARPETTGEYLERRVGETVRRPPVTTPRPFYEIVDSYLADLIAVPPGGAKSKAATQAASNYWENEGRPALYLMLTHAAIDERLTFIQRDGNGDFWRVYRGHARSCRISRQATLGYRGADCSCNRQTGKLTSDSPTLAALNVILEDDSSERSDFEDAAWFDLWIVDEVDFGRFVGRFEASERDLGIVAARYPQEYEPVRTLAAVLTDVLSAHRAEGLGESLNGQALYQSVDRHLRRGSTSLAALVAALGRLPRDLPTRQWARKRGDPQTLQGQPRNFPPYLVPIFLDEARHYLREWPFQPRVHLGGRGEALRIRWRRRVVERDTGVPGVDLGPTPFVVLDATADVELLGRVMPDIYHVHVPALQPWPDNVHVHQWAESVVTRKELGANEYDDDDGRISDNLESWFSRVEQELDGFDRSLSVGVITHEAIYKALRDRINGLGFKVTAATYFHNVRGSNKFEDCHILIVLGAPLPNPQGFKEECQAFFFDESEELRFGRDNWNQHKHHLTMRDGQEVEVLGLSYSPGLVAAYHEQKCQAELFQAVHRLRPYIQKEYERHILLFTNMGVRGVKLDRLIVDPEGRQGRAYKMAQAVKGELVSRGEVAVQEIARLMPEPGVTLDGNAAYIRRRGSLIAAIAGAVFVQGERRGRDNPARFTTTRILSL